LRNRLVRLMTNLDTELKHCAADLLFVLCKENGTALKLHAKLPQKQIEKIQCNTKCKNRNNKTSRFSIKYDDSIDK